MSINSRWHRADLIISPRGMVILAVVASVLFIAWAVWS